MFYRRPKKSWPPCANPTCPDPMGGRPGGSGNVTPGRLSGARFGLDGKVCHKCWTALYERERKAQRRAATGVVRRSRIEREAA